MARKAPAEWHGFYYTEREGKLVGLTMTPDQAACCEKLFQRGLTKIIEEEYWLSYGRFMMTHAPQCYIAWHGLNYWAVNLPNVGKDHKYVDGSQGLHVLEFSPKVIRHLWLERSEALAEELDDLVLTPWDWLLDGDGAENEWKIPPALLKVMRKNIAWTNEVHERMAAKFPPDKHW